MATYSNIVSRYIYNHTKLYKLTRIICCCCCCFPLEVKARTAKLVQVLQPASEITSEFRVGPALFGPDLGEGIADLSGELHVIAGQEGVVTEIGDGCKVFSEEDTVQSLDRVVMMARGGCLFVQKVREMYFSCGVSMPMKCCCWCCVDYTVHFLL